MKCEHGPSHSWCYLKGRRIYWCPWCKDWFYEETLERKNNYDSCMRCGEAPTLENKDDPCIANLPRVSYACCGHGIENEAYVSFPDGKALYKAPSILIMNFLLRLRNISSRINKLGV